jgi:hypothetical protein
MRQVILVRVEDSRSKNNLYPLVKRDSHVTIALREDGDDAFYSP